MKKVILDIETAGCDFDSLDEIAKEFFLKYAESQEKEAEIKESMSFYPHTAQVVAIGLQDADTDSSFVLFQAPGQAVKKEKESDTEFIQVSDEKALLELFWSMLKDYNQIVTFNGRGFDAPFLMLRSAINKIKPTKNLMPNRYSSDMHIDLLDRLTFFGSMRKRFNLHLWCKAFGIDSPKEGEVTGYQVKDLFNQGKYIEIARYCLLDIKATKALYLYWEKYLNF